MSDYIIRAIAAGEQIRAFAATTGELVEEARQRHNTSPVVTAALGRLLTAGAIMGSMMKGPKDLLTLQIKGDGPVHGLTVTADSSAQVKGYADNPLVILPANAKHKLDVGGAVGHGTLTVIKDMGLKEPYSGQVSLVSGEIAEDLTRYFAESEQVPSSVGLGVLMNRNNTVNCAGGFILQVLPNAEEETIAHLEQKLAGVSSVTSMLTSGMTPEDILKELLGDSDLQILDRVPTRFYCNCTKDRVRRALALINRQELKSMVEEGKPIEVRCHFCNTAYTLSVAELEEILQR